MTDMQYKGLFDLPGKVAVITGGSRGIGLHTATAFLHAGAARVYLLARKWNGDGGLQSALAALAALRTAGTVTGDAVGLSVDLAKADQVESVVQRLREEERKRTGGREGKIDILVANSATSWGGPFEETPDWAVGKVLNLNVQSVFNLVKLMTPLLSAAGSIADPSRIIIVGAGAGLTVPLGASGQHSIIAYGVSKAAAHHLTRYLAVELGPRHITSNAIAPGFFPSKLANGLIDIMGGLERMGKMNLMGRTGVPEDIAGLMVFLTSRAGSWVNGAVIEVDGGSHLGSRVETAEERAGSKL